MVEEKSGLGPPPHSTSSAPSFFAGKSGVRNLSIVVPTSTHVRARIARPTVCVRNARRPPSAIGEIVAVNLVPPRPCGKPRAYYYRSLLSPPARHAPRARVVERCRHPNPRSLTGFFADSARGRGVHSVAAPAHDHEGGGASCSCPQQLRTIFSGAPAFPSRTSHTVTRQFSAFFTLVARVPAIKAARCVRRAPRIQVSSPAFRRAQSRVRAGSNHNSPFLFFPGVRGARSGVGGRMVSKQPVDHGGCLRGLCKAP